MMTVTTMEENQWMQETVLVEIIPLKREKIKMTARILDDYLDNTLVHLQNIIQ